MRQIKNHLIEIIREKALLKGKVILSSGKKSSYYIDLRRISLSPPGLILISKLFFDYIQKYKITSVGGPSIGADPIVAGILYLASQRKYPLTGFLVRKQKKQHGTGAIIEGNIPTKKKKILLIDDVATTGGALIYSIDVLSAHGLRPLLCGCVVDRLSGARESIEKKGIKFFSLIEIEEIL